MTSSDPQSATLLTEVLEAGRRAIGDHIAPEHCYATGPLTGDPYRDLIECPACSFMALYKRIKGTNDANT